MKNLIPVPVAALGAALVLSACNQAAPASDSPPVVVTPASPSVVVEPGPAGPAGPAGAPGAPGAPAPTPPPAPSK